MRIAHVVSTFPPYKGGMGNVAREIAERTAARGHEVAVITPRRVESRELRVESDRESETINYQLSTINPVLRFGNAAWCPGIRREFERLQPDIIHLHWPFIGGIAPVLAWRRCDSSHNPSHTPSAATSSLNLSQFRTKLRKEDQPQFGAAPQEFHSQFRTKLRITNQPRRLVVQYHMDLIGNGWRGAAFSAYQYWTLPRVLALADRVVVSSLDYARHGALAPFVEQLGEKLVEIPLGVDAARFFPAEQPNPQHSTFRLLFVGGLDRAHAFKGLPILLEAIARVPAVRLQVVGDGELRPTYERQTQTLGIADRVTFFGAVPDEQLPEIYRNADVLALPSATRSEAFGLAVLEAMASGIATIASNLAGVRTIVMDGESGLLVPPGDVGALAEHIEKIASDPALAARLGAAGRTRAVEKYAWDRIVNQWASLYRSLV